MVTSCSDIIETIVSELCMNCPEKDECPAMSDDGDLNTLNECLAAALHDHNERDTKVPNGTFDPNAWERISEEPPTERSTNYDEDNCERVLVDGVWKCANGHRECIMNIDNVCNPHIPDEVCCETDHCNGEGGDWYNCPACGRRFHDCAGTHCPDCNFDCEPPLTQ